MHILYRTYGYERSDIKAMVSKRTYNSQYGLKIFTFYTKVQTKQENYFFYFFFIMQHNFTNFSLTTKMSYFHKSSFAIKTMTPEHQNAIKRRINTRGDYTSALTEYKFG